MFTKTSRTDRVREQVTDVGSTVGGNVSSAWRGKVAPTVSGKARDAAHWAAPHVERGREAAAPKVEAAVDKVSPAVEAAREKLEELLPRLAEAVSAAAAAGSAAGAHAGEYRARSGDAVAVLRGDAVAKRKHRVLRKLLLLPVIAAAVGASYAAFKSRAPKDDPWAVPTGTYPAYTPPPPTTPSASTAPPTTTPPADVSSALDADPVDDVTPAPKPSDPTKPADKN